MRLSATQTEARLSVDLCEPAIRRIDQTPKLQPFRELILHECPDGDERWNWVATAPVEEIVNWAQSLGYHQ
jgi:hypothetical protein